MQFLGAVKNIKVTDDIHQKLSRRGRYGMTMNEIIKELLDVVESKKKNHA